MMRTNAILPGAPSQPGGVGRRKIGGRETAPRPMTVLFTVLGAASALVCAVLGYAAVYRPNKPPTWLDAGDCVDLAFG